MVIRAKKKINLDNKKDRFQYQPWYIKLWRYRHYIPIPFMTVKYWFYERKRELKGEDDWKLSFSNMWGISKGLQHYKMNWVYDSEEVMEKLELKLENLKEKQ